MAKVAKASKAAALTVTPGVTINGTSGADNAYGKAGNDKINTKEGDDFIIGGQGNDAIDGGLGLDTAQFRGTFAESSVSMRNGIVTVSGIDGTDTLKGVETLLFNDGWFDTKQGKFFTPMVVTFDQVGNVTEGEDFTLTFHRSGGDLAQELDARITLTGDFPGVPAVHAARSDFVDAPLSVHWSANETTAEVVFSTIADGMDEGMVPGFYNEHKENLGLMLDHFSQATPEGMLGAPLSYFGFLVDA